MSERERFPRRAGIATLTARRALTPQLVEAAAGKAPRKVIAGA